MRTKILFFPLCIIAALIFTNCNSKDNKSDKLNQAAAKRNAPIAVDVMITKTTSVSEKIDLPGTIVANESTEIHPEVSGRIVQLNIQEGKIISKGSLLAKLYDGDLQAQLNKLQVQLKLAMSQEERSQKLLDIQGISKQDYESSLLTVENIKADIAIIKTAIDKTSIRAPFSGKIGLRDVSIGAYVTPASILATINQVSELKVDFTVPEKYVDRVKLGQMISFYFEGNDKTYQAKVVASEANLSDANRSLTMRAKVIGDVKGLVPGSFAKVQLKFPPNPNAIMIPTQAIIPQARGKQVVIYNNGDPKFVDVVTGFRDSSNVEIVSGLKAGDTVVYTGLLSIRPNSKLKMGRE